MRRLRILARGTAARLGAGLAHSQGVLGAMAVGVGCYLRFSVGTALIVVGVLLLLAAFFQSAGGARR